MSGQRVLDVARAEGEADLAQVAGIGTQQGELERREAGEQHEPVEAVALDGAPPHRAERGEELGANRRTGLDAGGWSQAEVVDPRARLPERGQLEGPLVGDLHAHLLEDGQDRRQRQFGAGVDLEADLAAAVIRLGVQGGEDAAVVAQGVDLGEVGNGVGRSERLAVRRRKAMFHASERVEAGLLPQAGHERVTEVVHPPARDGGKAPLDGRLVDVGGRVRAYEHEDVQPGQHAGGYRRVVLRRLPAVGVEEDLVHPLDDRGRVPVARHVDQARDEAPIVVASGEEADLAALLQVEDAHRHGEQLVGTDLEQVVARERLEDVAQLSSAVAVERQRRSGLHRLHLAAQHRDVDGA
jgi:hypothetical protein